MSVRRRIARLETLLHVGPDADGACRYCRGRTDLGRNVVFDQHEDGPVTLKPGRDASPTPCPRCGRDLNNHIVIHRVDMIGKRREEAEFTLAGE